MCHLKPLFLNELKECSGTERKKGERIFSGKVLAGNVRRKKGWGRQPPQGGGGMR